MEIPAGTPQCHPEIGAKLAYQFGGVNRSPENGSWKPPAIGISFGKRTLVGRKEIVMYNRILVTVDGSVLSETILPEVQRLVSGTDCEVVLLIVRDVPRGVSEDEPERLMMLGTAPAMVPEHEQRETRDQAMEGIRDEAIHYLESLAAPLRSSGVPVRITVHFGSPTDLIVRAAEEEGADLIAMATHGNTGLRRMIFGSVASHVVENTNKPVLLVRPEHLEG